MFDVKMRGKPVVVRKESSPTAVFACVALHLPAQRWQRVPRSRARTELDAHIDLDALAPPYAEQPLALLAELPTLVSAFTFRSWTPFFVLAYAPPFLARRSAERTYDHATEPGRCRR